MKSVTVLAILEKRASKAISWFFGNLCDLFSVLFNDEVGEPTFQVGRLPSQAVLLVPASDSRTLIGAGEENVWNLSVSDIMHPGPGNPWLGNHTALADPLVFLTSYRSGG